jgi:periplasmic divalent cation tolerance protein
MSYLLAYITAADMDEAEKIGKDLVENRLAACVNVFPFMQSMYMWKGSMEKSQETVIIAKTTDKLKDRLVDQVKKVTAMNARAWFFCLLQGETRNFCVG